MELHRLTSALLLVLLCVLCVGAGCRRPAISNQGENTTIRQAAAISRQSQASHTTGFNPCGLLTDQEIGSAIGPHKPGTNTKSRLGAESCRWIATTVQKEGWTDSIEVQIFTAALQSWERRHAKGEAVSGFGDGARFDASYGQLSFNCDHGGFCVLKANTWSAENREGIARSLAQLVAKRLE